MLSSDSLISVLLKYLDRCCGNNRLWKLGPAERVTGFFINGLKGLATEFGPVLEKALRRTECFKLFTLEFFGEYDALCIESVDSV